MGTAFTPRSLIELIDEAVARHRDLPAYTCLGKTIRFSQFDAESGALAAWLSTLGLEANARVAVMLPNVLQNPLAIAAVIRAGFVVVNVNPLYTARELALQLNDSGASAIIVLENFAHVVQKAHEAYGLASLRHVMVTGVGDRLGAKGKIINFLVRHVKRLVRPWSFVPQWRLWRLNTVLAGFAGRRPAAIDRRAEDLAFLQYTGGTTGVAKGAMLSHGNVLANLAQCDRWLSPKKLWEKLPPGQSLTMVCALPLYHIFSLTACFFLGLQQGFRNLLIPNPRDLDAMVGTLERETVHLFPGVTTLFNALLNHPRFGRIDFSSLQITVGGGMAVTPSVALRWKSKTGCPMLEGYGLSETSPVVSATPQGLTEFTGTVGLPMHDTEVKIVDDAGQGLPAGSEGEIAVRGPQVMQGYWNNPNETAQAFTQDGFFKTGDIGVIDARGELKILDRKKDMILVGGFNVYPSEIEQVVAGIANVRECAAVGLPDPGGGETVKLFVVRASSDLTAEQIHEHCKAHLTNYKRPRDIEFTAELPKTNVGKVMRRALRDPAHDKP